MKYTFAKRISLLIPFLLVGIVLAASCTGELDWSGISFPCSNTRPCATGFTCQGGICVDPKTATEAIPDAGEPDKVEAKIRVAFLYVGPVGDFGWTWSHEQGRLHLDKLGYDTTAAGPISPQDAPKQMEEFIKNGFNLIVGTSHDFLVPLLETAASNPDLKFLTCSGFKTTPNMGSYFARMYQVEWLAGKIAGAMTKTNRVALLAPIAIPEVIRHINAFTLGVRSVNPNAVVAINWIGNWFNPETEPKLTQELIDNDADVIHSHSDTSIPLEFVENAKGDPLKTKDGNPVFTIGYNGVNACNFGPRTCLGSAYWNWGPIMERIVSQVKNGTWDPKKIIWESLKNDKNDSAFHLSDISNKVPGTDRIKIEEWFPKLSKEENQQMPFVGPLKDNTGKERLASGKSLDDQKLLNICWFVDGVMELDGTTPAAVPSLCQGDR